MGPRRVHRLLSVPVANTSGYDAGRLLAPLLCTPAARPRCWAVQGLCSTFQKAVKTVQPEEEEEEQPQQLYSEAADFQGTDIIT